MLSLSIALITAALVLYTAGVWTEHRAGRLTWRHLALFASGLAFDASGTFAMSRLAASGAFAARGTSGVLTSMMAVTGAVALVLMALHLTWGAVVLIRNRPNELATFHRLSVGVWMIWLLPYVTGALGAAI